jgi:hypothetical protein
LVTALKNQSDNSEFVTQESCFFLFLPPPDLVSFAEELASHLLLFPDRSTNEGYIVRFHNSFHYLSGRNKRPKNCTMAGMADIPKDHLQAFSGEFQLEFVPFTEFGAGDVVFLSISILSVHTNKVKYRPSHTTRN